MAVSAMYRFVFSGLRSETPNNEESQINVTTRLHREAEKRNQFSSVRIFFNAWQKPVNFLNIH